MTCKEGGNMPLIDCPDCGKKVSSEAPTCPGCGRPLKTPQVQPLVVGARKCPHCGADGVGKVRGLQGGGEVLIAIVLFFLFIIPGIIYYIYMESVPYCSGCGRRVWK